MPISLNEQCLQKERRKNEKAKKRIQLAVRLANT
jgi:hypothetical protein